jgi:hypothetical protein
MLKAFGVILWHFKVVQINRDVIHVIIFKKNKNRGATYRAPWRDFTGAMGRGRDRAP